MSLIPLLKAFSLTSVTLSGKVTASVSALLYTFFRLPPLKVSSQIKGLPFPLPMLVILQELLPIIILSGTLISVGQTILEVLSFCSIFVMRKFVASPSLETLSYSNSAEYVLPPYVNVKVLTVPAFPKITTIITLRIRSAVSIIIDTICFSFLKFVFIMKSPRHKMYFFNPLFIFVLHIDYTYPASSLSAKIFFITSVIFSPTSP